MSSDCVLCSFQESCGLAPLFLYPTTPILNQILMRHLDDMGILFEQKNEVLDLSRHGSPDRFLVDLRNRLSPAERADIRIGRERGAALMTAPTLEAWGKRSDTSWFEDAVRDDKFTMHFQPIVDSSSGEVFGHECLIRLFTDRTYNGGEIMDAVFERGRVHLFDSYARRLSIRKAAAQHVPGTKVFINFMPSSIYDPAFCMQSALDELSRTKMKAADIVFEVVESDQVTDARHLLKICEYYRSQNFGFALDDVGTGSNSLQMVCDLSPDYVKLDKSLISNIDKPAYRAIVGKLADFSAQFNFRVIAEGIEDAHSAEILRDMGIGLMQGYYFGKPAPQMLKGSAKPTPPHPESTAFSIIRPAASTKSHSSPCAA